MEKTKEKDNLSVSGSKKRPLNKSILFISVSLIAVFVTGGYFLTNKLISNEKSVEQKIKKIESIVNGIDLTINKNQSMFTNIKKKLEQYKSEKDVLADLLSQPVQGQFDINKDYALAEVEHLLTIASHNLLLGYNYDTTVSALDAASIRLAGIAIDDAKVIKEQLDRDVGILKSSNQVDLSKSILFLSNLSDRIDSLPLKKILMKNKLQNNKEIDYINEDKVKNFLTIILEELKSLIIIRRNENVTQDFFLPDEINLLKLNIKFELANAKLALLNRDKKSLENSILQINNYLEDYYDLSNVETQDIHDQLSQIVNLDFSTPNIDINSSLESVRALIHSRNKSDASMNNRDMVN